MIEINKEYIFNWRIIDGTEQEEDKEILLNNSGMNCMVLEILETREHGRLVLVESANGSIFNCYELELDELKDSDIRCFDGYDLDT